MRGARVIWTTESTCAMTLIMNVTDPDDPKQKQGPVDKTATRQARLKAALQANISRRKVQARARRGIASPAPQKPEGRHEE